MILLPYCIEEKSKKEDIDEESSFAEYSANLGLPLSIIHMRMLVFFAQLNFHNVQYIRPSKGEEDSKNLDKDFTENLPKGS